MSIETEALPVRPRRKLLTPLTLSLAGVLACAVGFIGGVLVQKDAQAGGGGGLPTALAGAGPSGGGAGAFRTGGSSSASATTVGEVANVKGGTLYVTDSQGNTVKVETDDGSTVTRTAKSNVKKIRPGDRVVVQGTQAADGTVEAASIAATAPGAEGAALGAFGGGRAPSGRGQQGGDGDAVDQLFQGG